MLFFNGVWHLLIIAGLYIFLFLIYKEMKRNFSDVKVGAVLSVVTDLDSNNLFPYKKGEMFVIYTDRNLKINGENIYIKDGKILIENDEQIKDISPGEIFEFAGGSLQLVRCNDGNTIANEYRLNQKSK